MGWLPTLTLQPGLYTEATDRGAEGRWKDGNNVRFYQKNPEKIGGCVKLIVTQFLGICRSMLGWSTLSYSPFVALGTSKKLYLTDAASFYDITPYRATGTLGNNPFTTVNGSALVTVAHVAHGNAAGAHVHYSGAAAVGGLTLNGEFIVFSVPTADTYVITAPSNATSGATGGGAAVAYQYEIAVGQDDTIFGTGWGMGGWGLGTWGTPRALSGLSLARVWSLDNWGEDLLCSPQDSPLYVWSASSGTNTRAALITNAPAQNRKVLVFDQLRIAISFGAHDGSNFDRMLLRWCDSEDYTDWTPTVTNLAGDKRLDHGDEIITAVKSRSEIAVFTDNTLYSVTLSGDDTVFSVESKGTIQAVMGPEAAVDVNGTVYAMCLDKFIAYDGQVKDIPCEVRSRVFSDINITQRVKVFAEWNPTKDEVLFHYVSGSSTEIDKVVGYNINDGSWWLGDSSMARTAWLQKHPFTNTTKMPLATKSTGYLMQQETGVDNDGVAIPYFLESYDAEIGASNPMNGPPSGQGQLTYRVKGIIPDFVRLAGNHTAQVKGRKFPNDAQQSRGVVNFNPRVRHIDSHLRARQISIRIASSELGSDIAIGGWRVNADVRGGR